MTKMQDIPVVEPTGKLKFTNTLYEHVLKHVLKCREEQWTQLIDADQLAEARREMDEQLPKKPMLCKTMQDYRHILSESTIRLTREGRGHQHLYWEPVYRSETERFVIPDGAVQTVQLWELDKKILIIAKSFVRNGEFTPYKLCTGFRPFPKLSGNSLQKNIKRRLRERRTSRWEILLADHDL